MDKDGWGRTNQTPVGVGTYYSIPVLGTTSNSNVLVKSYYDGGIRSAEHSKSYTKQTVRCRQK